MTKMLKLFAVVMLGGVLLFGGMAGCKKKKGKGGGDNQFPAAGKARTSANQTTAATVARTRAISKFLAWSSSQPAVDWVENSKRCSRTWPR